MQLPMEKIWKDGRSPFEDTRKHDERDKPILFLSCFITFYALWTLFANLASMFLLKWVPVTCVVCLLKKKGEKKKKIYGVFSAGYVHSDLTVKPPKDAHLEQSLFLKLCVI